MKKVKPKKKNSNYKKQSTSAFQTEEDVLLAFESMSAYLKQLTPEKRAILDADEAAQTADMAEFHRKFMEERRNQKK